MAQLNTISLSDFTRLADFEWLSGQESIKPVAKTSGLFKVVPFPANSGDTKEFNEVDLEEYADEKDEGDQADQARVQQGYSKVLNLQRFGKDISVTWEMRNRGKYPDVLSRIQNLSSMMVNRQDLDLTHRITFGTATSYVNRKGRTIDISVGDGLALFSTVHTLKGSSTTYRNILANNPQLSKGSLEGMEKLTVEQTFNHFGEKVSSMDDILFTTDDPNTVNTARELIQSTAEISAPNAGVVNVYQSKYRHIVLPRLATDATGAPDTTKSKYFGIASSKRSSAYLATEQEPTLNAPAMANNAADVSTEDWTYTGRCSYGITIVGGNWIKLSKGDGTA
jgi:hypothetical protein